MNYYEAKFQLNARKKMTRESWDSNFYIEIVPIDPNYRPKFTDSCGRNYDISSADELATDWLIYGD